MIYTVNEVVE